MGVTAISNPNQRHLEDSSLSSMPMDVWMTAGLVDSSIKKEKIKLKRVLHENDSRYVDVLL